MSACPGCGACLKTTDGPRHPYMTGSAACWARFGEVLAVQYASPRRMSFHQLVVDAYAAQHPGSSDRRAVQSVALHLMTLALVLEDGADPALGPKLHRRMTDRPVFGPLSGRLPSPGERTVTSVPLVGPIAAAESATRAWAQDVWASWSEHHATVREWLDVSHLTGRQRT